MTDDNGEGAKSDTSGMGARRTGVVALGVALLAVLAAVLLTGTRPVHGKSAVDAAALRAPDEVAVLPTAPQGTELVSSPGEQWFIAAMVGGPTRHRSGGAMLDISLDNYQAVAEAPKPTGRAPDGYRWLLLTFHVANVDRYDWPVRMFQRVSAIDDRGQSLAPLGEGQLPCAGQDAVATGLRAGAETDVCGLIPVPSATTLLGVQFELLRFPVLVPPVSTAPAPPTSAPVTDLISDGIPIHLTVDVVLTPSGYFGGKAPREPGTRFVVVRMAITVTGRRDLIPVNHPYLLDDRGALLADTGTGWYTPGCRQALIVVRSGKPDWGCYVFAIDADVPVAGVTWGPDSAKFGEWPRWTVG